VKGFHVLYAPLASPWDRFAGVSSPKISSPATRLYRSRPIRPTGFSERLHDVERTDGLVIVGGGPAGLSAAIEARRAGVKSVCVLDEGVAPGGQIYRATDPGSPSPTRTMPATNTRTDRRSLARLGQAARKSTRALLSGRVG